MGDIQIKEDSVFRKAEWSIRVFQEVQCRWKMVDWSHRGVVTRLGQEMIQLLLVVLDE